jgi:hypothetical protein
MILLPTPHGEREPLVAGAAAGNVTVFQPLMGNGNTFSWPRKGDATAASNPSWGTGTALRRIGRRRYSPSNPSWGTGTRRAHIVIVKRMLLPTPHGEREPRRSSGRRSSRRASNPSWGTGTLPPLRILTSQKATGYREITGNAMLLGFGGRQVQQVSRSNPNL